MNYQLKSLKNFFVREDVDGTIILERISNRQIMLNKTGTQVFNMVRTETPLSTIHSEMCKEYPNVHEDIIKEDVISVLTLLDLYGVISYSTNDNLLGFHIAKNSEYKEIKELSKKEDIFVFPTTLSSGYLDPIEMRLRVANNSEQFAYSKYKDNSCALIGYIPIIQSSNTIQLTAILVDKNLDITLLFKEFSDLMISIYSGKECLKLRWVVEENVFNERRDFFEGLISQEFFVEAKLHQENEKGTVLFLSKVLK